MFFLNKKFTKYLIISIILTYLITNLTAQKLYAAASDASDLELLLRTFPGLQNAIVDDYSWDTKHPRLVFKDPANKTYFVFDLATLKTNGKISVKDKLGKVLMIVYADKKNNEIKFSSPQGQPLGSIAAIIAGKRQKIIFKDKLGKVFLSASEKGNKILWKNSHEILIAEYDTKTKTFKDEREKNALGDEFKRWNDIISVLPVDNVSPGGGLGGAFLALLIATTIAATAGPIGVAIVGSSIIYGAINLAYGMIAWATVVPASLVLQQAQQSPEWALENKGLVEEALNRLGVLKPQPEKSIECTESFIGIPTGECFVDNTLATYRTLSTSNPITLIYTSRSAKPHTVISTETNPLYEKPVACKSSTTSGSFARDFCKNTAPPADKQITTFSVEFYVPESKQTSKKIYYQSDNSLPPSEATSTQSFFWNAISTDGNYPPTGLYPYTVSKNFYFSDGSQLPFKSTLYAHIINNRTSPFGIGWDIAGIQRIFPSPDGGTFLLITGGGTRLKFTTSGYNYSPGEVEMSWAILESPPGDYSALKVERLGDVRTDPSAPYLRFTRTLKDGTIIEFDNKGRQTSIKERNKKPIAIEYDSYDRLTKIIDPAGKITEFIYGTDGLISEIKHQDNRTSKFEHTNGNLTKIITPDNSETIYEYDSNNLLTSHTIPHQPTAKAQYDYNEYFRVTQTTSPTGRITKFDPAIFHTLLDKTPTTTGTKNNPADPVLTKNLKDTVTFNNGNSKSQKTSALNYPEEITDTLNRTTTYKRDKNGNPTEIKYPNGLTITNTYSPTGDLKSTYDGRSTTKFFYNNFGQITSITNPKQNITRFTYNPTNGNLISITDALNYTTTNSYEDSRFPSLSTKIRNPLDKETFFSYNSDGNLDSIKNAFGYTTSMTYDPAGAGNITSIKDAEGHGTNFTYDLANRLTSVTDADSYATTYEYDKSGNLKTVIAANSEKTTLEYDTESKLKKITNPLGKEKKFDYDNINGNLETVTDMKNQTFTYEYDQDNEGDRLVKKTMPGDTVEYNYEENTDNLEEISDNDSKLTMKYTLQGRLEKVETWEKGAQIPQPHTIINYQYDLNGNLREISPSFLDGSNIYSYDALDRLTEVSIFATTEKFKLDYDELSRRKTLNYPNGLTTDYEYDDIGQLATMTTTLNGQTFATYSYTYDKVGNRKTMLDDDGTHIYTYDELYRLTNADHPEGSSIPDEKYRYDSVGNRLDPNPYGFQYFYYYSGNRLGADDNLCAYEYDDNGNTIEKDCSERQNKRYSFQYNSENQLTETKIYEGNNTTPSITATYGYDALGRRIWKNANGVVTKYIYSGEDVIAEFDQWNNLIAKYIHGPGIDEPLVMIRGDKKYYFVYDALGSVTALTDQQGSIVNKYLYDSFGNIATQTVRVQNSYTFAGYQYDTETGLYYLRARYYDPQTGRFIQEDPIGKINPYVYTGNSPLTYVDPFGADMMDAYAALNHLGSTIIEVSSKHNLPPELLGGILAVEQYAGGLPSALNETISQTLAGLGYNASIGVYQLQVNNGMKVRPGSIREELINAMLDPKLETELAAKFIESQLGESLRNKPASEWTEKDMEKALNIWNNSDVYKKRFKELKEFVKYMLNKCR